MIWYLEQKDCLKHLPFYYEDFAQVVTLQRCADALLEKMRSQMEGIIAGRFLEGEMEYPIEQYEKLFSLEKAPEPGRKKSADSFRMAGESAHQPKDGGSLQQGLF